MADQVFLTTEQLAERYQTTTGAILGQRKMGHGPPGFRFGRRVLYSLAAVEAWEREQAETDRLTGGRPAAER